VSKPGRSSWLAIAPFSWLLSACGTLPPAADAIPCCLAMGLDVRPILGDQFTNCGTYEQLYLSAISRIPSERALKCARRELAARRPFMFTYEQNEPPDVSITHVAVFGANGERVLVQSGIFGDENIAFAGSCDELTVEKDGYPTHENCSASTPLIESLRSRATVQEAP
jgi:hypothetical protein